MPKRNRIELLFLTAVFATEIFNPNLILAEDLSNVSLDSQLISKKSGGRSGGGSFKSRPSKSKPSKSRSSSPRRSNYNQRKSTPAPSYRKKPVRTYRDRSLSPSNRNRLRPSRRSNSSGFGGLIWLIFFLLIAGVIIYLLYKMFSQIFGSSSTANKIIKERDNDRVTVSLLQVALSSAANGIQQELSELSRNTDTDSESGLVTLMQESALILLRHEIAWTHVLSSSVSLDINQAESSFDKLSITERSKFSRETLSNMDGTLKTKEMKNVPDEEFADYVVVTLILGTADDRPLFTKINTATSLKEELLQLASMRDDYLLKFELLWTPQQIDQYLTDDELLLEYSNIIPLA